MDNSRPLMLAATLLAVVIVTASMSSSDVGSRLATLESRVHTNLEYERVCFANEYGAVPYLDLPMEFRVPNYAGGSCVHASMETAFNWQGLYELADWWKQSYSGGEYSARLNRRLDAAGIRYAYTMGSDRNVAGKNWRFLEKACELRLGCAVNYPENHMVFCCGIDEHNVYLIDNNYVSRVQTLSREAFGRRWTGWAVTPVYTPPSPKPYSVW
jgi:hypothetical protein